MKHELQQSITESLRLYEQISGQTVCQLRWSSEAKEATVVVRASGSDKKKGKVINLFHA